MAPSECLVGNSGLQWFSHASYKQSLNGNHTPLNGHPDQRGARMFWKWTFLILDANFRPGHSGGGLHKRQGSQHVTFFRNLAFRCNDRRGCPQTLQYTKTQGVAMNRLQHGYQMNSLKLSIRSSASATALQVMRPAWVFTPRANAGSARRASRPLSASRRA